MSDATAVFVTLLLVAAYFLPTGIALLRKKRNTLPIFVVNLLFGWTLIGWLFTLIWSMLADNVPVPTNVTVTTSATSSNR